MMQGQEVIIFTRVTQGSFSREYHGPALLFNPNGVTCAIRFEFTLQLIQRFPRRSQSTKCRAALILKSERKEVYFKGWTWEAEKSKLRFLTYTLGSSNTLSGNGRVQLCQLFFACGLRVCSAIKAVLHLKLSFIIIGRQAVG